MIVQKAPRAAVNQSTHRRSDGVAGTRAAHASVATKKNSGRRPIVRLIAQRARWNGMNTIQATANAPGMVRIHAHSTRPATPHRTAERR